MSYQLSTGRTFLIFLLLLFQALVWAQDVDLSSESPENEFDYLANSSFGGEEGREGGVASLKRLKFRVSYGVNSASGGNRTNGKSSYFGSKFENSYDGSIQYFFNPSHSLNFQLIHDDIDYNLNTTSFIETEGYSKESLIAFYAFSVSRIEFKIGFSESEEFAFFNVKNIIADVEKLKMTSYFIGAGSYFPVIAGFIAKISFQYHNISYDSNSFKGSSGIKKVFDMDLHYRGFKSVGIKLSEEILTYDTDEGQRIFTMRVMPYVQF